jgi:hypothetical protein
VGANSISNIFNIFHKRVGKFQLFFYFIGNQFKGVFMKNTQSIQVFIELLAAGASLVYVSTEEVNDLILRVNEYCEANKIDIRTLKGRVLPLTVEKGSNVSVIAKFLAEAAEHNPDFHVDVLFVDDCSVFEIDYVDPSKHKDEQVRAAIAQIADSLGIGAYLGEEVCDCEDCDCEG